MAGRGAAAPGRAHQPGAHPGAGLARGQRLAGDARLRREPLGRRPAERDRRQHQQPHHRRRLPRPPELRLGRHLPDHPRRASCSATGSTTRRDSFVEIQTDTVSEAARVLLPLIARDLWYSGEPAAAGSAGAAAAGGARAARRLERRDERAHARAADLRRLDAGAEAAAGAGRARAAAWRWCRAPSRSSSSGSTATSTAPAAWCDVRRRRRPRAAPRWRGSRSTTR